MNLVVDVHLHPDDDRSWSVAFTATSTRLMIGDLTLHVHGDHHRGRAAEMFRHAAWLIEQEETS